MTVEVTRVVIKSEESEDGESYDLSGGEDLADFLLPVCEVYQRSRGKGFSITVRRVRREAAAAA